MTEDEVRRNLRLDMGFYSFRYLITKRTIPTINPRQRRSYTHRFSTLGIMKEIDATKWIRNGGACLVGWTEGPSSLKVEGDPPNRSTDTLVRVFIR